MFVCCIDCFVLCVAPHRTQSANNIYWWLIMFWRLFTIMKSIELIWLKFDVFHSFHLFFYRCFCCYCVCTKSSNFTNSGTIRIHLFGNCLPSACHRLSSYNNCFSISIVHNVYNVLHTWIGKHSVNFFPSDFFLSQST